jgi:hypothetical protein
MCASVLSVIVFHSIGAIRFCLSGSPHRADIQYCAIVATHNPTVSISMEPDTLVQQQYFLELPGEPSDAATPVEARVNDADATRDAARSEENILQWTSYLPADCVRTMIEMGWDVTT